MNVEQMKLVVKEIVTKTDLTPCIVGHRGVGKSAGIRQLAHDIGLSYRSVRLGQMEVGDLIGIPFREGSVMFWSKPCWWPEENDPPTLIHCDELNRAQQEDTLQAIFQFVEPPPPGGRRALHTHTLSPRHKVVVTINPPDGTYQVAPLDRALIDRMILLHVESDLSCWLSYASRQGLDQDVRGFVSLNRDLLARQGERMEILAEPTERGWEMVSILKQQCRIPPELEVEVYAGIVGTEAAIAFVRWSRERSDRPVAAADILSRWDEVRLRAAAQRDDLQAATIADLVAHLKEHGDISEPEELNLVAYIDTLPRDLKFALVKSLLAIPPVAARLSSDRHDSVILDAIRQISTTA